MAAFILITFYATMVIAGYVVELVFGSLRLIPGRAGAKIPDRGVGWETPPGRRHALLPGCNRRAPGAATGGVHGRDMGDTPNTGPGKILLVERDPVLALFAETILSVWEAFEVTAVPNGAVAAALIERESWDLVVADYELPGTEALQLLAAVRREAPDLPFAMISAFPVLERDAMAMASADGFITKPMKPSHLIGLATGLIERSRRMREQSAGGSPSTGIF